MVTPVNYAPPSTTATPPPVGGVGGVSLPPPEPQPKRSTGGLPIGLISAIQSVYIRENQKRTEMQGKPGLELQPGWGGQGR